MDLPISRLPSGRLPSRRHWSREYADYPAIGPACDPRSLTNSLTRGGGMRMRSVIVLVLASGVLAIGGVAYATDANDQGSGDRAWAQVDPNAGSPVLVKTKNFVSVSSPSTGVYCPPCSGRDQPGALCA